MSGGSPVHYMITRDIDMNAGIDANLAIDKHDRCTSRAVGKADWLR